MKNLQKWGVLGLFAVASAGALFSQNTGIQRSVIQKSDVSVPGREALIVRIDIPAGVAAGRHTHFGEEITYVMEGEMDLMIEGQPTRRLKAGEGFIVPNGVKHDARATGTGVLKLSGVFVVEKGKALLTPAP